jgi:hypothetical protein
MGAVQMQGATGVSPSLELAENGLSNRIGGSLMHRQRVHERTCSQNLPKAKLRRFMLWLKQNPRLVFAYATSAFLLALFLLMIASVYVFLKSNKMPSKSVVGSNPTVGAPDTMRITNIASNFGHLFDTKRALVGILFSERVVTNKHEVLPTRNILEQRVCWAIPNYGGLDIKFFEYENMKYREGHLQRFHGQKIGMAQSRNKSGQNLGCVSLKVL